MGQDPPPKNGYERRKQRKRAQILAAATEILRRQGISRVSVAQIADHAGVSQVTIYNHFGDKAGLVEAVLVGVAEQRIEAYREILKADAPWSERLARVVRDKRRLLRDFHGEYMPTMYRQYPEIVARLRDMQLTARDSLTIPFLEEGRKLGCVPAGVTNEVVMSYLEVVMRGFDSSPDVVDRIAEDPKIFDQIHDLILYGLVRRDGESMERSSP